MSADSDPAAPSDATLHRAQVLWSQSGEDLKAAKAIRRENGLQSAFLSLQSAVNGLSAVCHLNGHFHLPMGSPAHLMALCAEADGRFGDLAGPSSRLEEAMESNPFDPKRNPKADAELGRHCLDEAKRVHQLVKAYLKDNRGRFFSP